VTRSLECDVCVVGAGAGGAVVAAELAEGGARVVLLEQGPYHDADRFSARVPEMLASLYRDAGQTITIGNPPIVMPLGSGLGGTTLVNSGTCFRTPESVLATWREQFDLQIDERELDLCFSRVEEAISVGEVDARLAGRNAAVARRGAQRLGWSHGYLRRNAKGCVGSGVCAFGCPTSAKQHTGITYVPRAREAGAEVVTGATVQRIALRGSRFSHVEAATADGGALEVHAEHVVLAAGTVHTPGLLAGSGLGLSSGQLGRNLSVHPATAVFALMDERVDMGHGVPQSFYVDEFAHEGIMFEGIAGPPSYAAMSLPLSGERHAQAMERYPYLAQFGLMVSDSSRGSVHTLAGATAGRLSGAAGRVLSRIGKAPIGQAPLIRYDLDDADLRRFRTGLQRLRELFEAAGAREVYLPLPEGVTPERAGRGDLRLMAFHPLGTARAHARAGEGVVDGDLALHGVEGVHVADGSVVPSSLGVNPQLTIMALATRLAFHLLGREVPGAGSGSGAGGGAEAGSEAGAASGSQAGSEAGSEAGGQAGSEAGSGSGSDPEHVVEIHCPS
jgi:choline dehydrogenase-like flavoprotein